MPVPLRSAPLEVLLVLLIAVLVIAVGTAVLVVGKGRRQAQIDATPRPALGSPAQVWLARGERLLAELRAELAGNEGLDWVAVDAAEVVGELQETAVRVAELDQALTRIDSADPQGRLRAVRQQLLAAMEAGVRGLEHAKAEVTALITEMGLPFGQTGANERLATRVEGLRAGLAEVQRLASPRIGGDDQGHP